MEWVEVDRARFREGADVPHVCVLSGREADGTTEFRLSYTPGWTFILLLFGILPFFVASWFAAQRVTLHLPVERAARDRLRGRRQLAAVGFAGGLAAVVGGLAMSSTVLTWAGVALALAGLLWLAVAPNVPRWRPTTDPSTLRLGGVHPDFIVALQRHEAVA